MTAQQHWQRVYETKRSDEVSWYAPHLAESLRLIRALAPPPARVVDVGAGASTLVDDLLDLGYREITLVDVSDAALAVSRTRLGDRAKLVTWITGDVTALTFEAGAFDVWHDRAVFHFLTEQVDRQAYVATLQKSLAPGGYVVISTFALDGPTRCSGLDVQRYDASALSRELGPNFELKSEMPSDHSTPSGNEQRFVTCSFRKLR